MNDINKYLFFEHRQICVNPIELPPKRRDRLLNKLIYFLPYYLIFQCLPLNTQCISFSLMEASIDDNLFYR